MAEVAIAHTPERVTWDQISARHAGEWVLLVDVDWIDDVEFEPRSAVVVAHSIDRRETIARVKELHRPLEFAHFFIPEPSAT